MLEGKSGFTSSVLNRLHSSRCWYNCQFGIIYEFFPGTCPIFNHGFQAPWHEVLCFTFLLVPCFYAVRYFLHSSLRTTSLPGYIVPSANYGAAAAKSLQSCPTLCNLIGGSPPGSPVPGILQARTLEWVAIAFSNAWKWKVKVKLLSRVRLLATPWTAAYQVPPSMGFSRQEYWSGLPLPSPIMVLLPVKENTKWKMQMLFMWECRHGANIGAGRSWEAELLTSSPCSVSLSFNCWVVLQGSI